jgi:hypothetical protein
MRAELIRVRLSRPAKQDTSTASRRCRLTHGGDRDAPSRNASRFICGAWFDAVFVGGERRGSLARNFHEANVD